MSTTGTILSFQVKNKASDVGEVIKIISLQLRYISKLCSHFP